MRHKSTLLVFMGILPAFLVMVYSIITRNNPEITVVLFIVVISLILAWLANKGKVLLKAANTAILLNHPVLDERTVSDLQRTQVPVGINIKKEGRIIGSALRGTQLKFNDSYDGQDDAEQQWVYIPDLQLRQTDSLRPPLYGAAGLATYNAVPIAAGNQIEWVLEALPHSSCEGEPVTLDCVETVTSQAATPIDFSALFMDSQSANDELILAYNATEEQPLPWASELEWRNKEVAE